jgi:hypothetical protein
LSLEEEDLHMIATVAQDNMYLINYNTFIKIYQGVRKVKVATDRHAYINSFS